MKNKVECFDISHRRDVVRECEGSPTLCARMGTGGNNIPIVLVNNSRLKPKAFIYRHCHAVCFDGCVRRLTPIECERLQGFPDEYTRIPYRGKPAENCPDAPRYKAIGNSWPVPVIRWIGRRITKELEECQKRSK